MLYRPQSYNVCIILFVLFILPLFHELIQIDYARQSSVIN